MEPKYYTINGKLRLAVRVASCKGGDYINYQFPKTSKTNSNEKVYA